MPLRFVFLAAAAAILWLGFSASPTLAQTPSFRVETRVVEVPVVVRDRKTGQNVTGLTATDFVILENGKPQRIDFSALHTTSTRVDLPVAAGQTPDIAPAIFSNRRSAEGDGPPVVAVLIDGFNARYEEQYYAAQAAAGVIAGSEQKSQWSLYFLGRNGLRILHDYSTDNMSLVERLRKLRASGDSIAGLGADAADRIPTGKDLFKLDLEVEMRIRTTLYALRDIGRHLSALPGRKSVIWFPAGLPLNSIVLHEAYLWHSTLDTLNDANVAVYSIDSAGLRPPMGYRAETPTTRGFPPGIGGNPMAPTQLLDAISAETGGRSFKNTNNLRSSFAQALTDSRTFYRLTYRSSNQKWDGRYVPIEVKVPRRSGLDIRHRLGYQARPLSPVTQTNRDLLLAQVIRSPLEAVEVGLSVRLTPIAGSDDSALRLTVDPGSVMLDEGAGNYLGRFDVRFVQASVESKVLDDFTDEVNLNLQPAEATRTHGEGFNYDRKLKIHPETRTLKIAFCDHATGRLGSLRVQLPAVTQ